MKKSLTGRNIKRIAFVGNYLPRQCGIATFTTDLCEAIAARYKETTCIALPVNDVEAGYAYPPRVRFELTERDINSYSRAADFLNINSVDLVCLQFEYGIFGGKTGSHILSLLRELRMPIVTTLHTILKDPDVDQKRVLEEVAALSDRLVVMSERGSEFLQQSGIVTAMVGLLNAPKGTKLEKRLENEGRLLGDFNGNNTDYSINFIPAMNSTMLMDGYKKIVKTIYSPKYFYERVMRFLKDFEPKKKKVFHLNPNYIMALFRSIFKLGVIGEERIYYWKLFLWTLFRKPQLFSLAILFAIYGFHFKKISNTFY